MDKVELYQITPPLKPVICTLSVSLHYNLPSPSYPMFIYLSKNQFLTSFTNIWRNELWQEVSKIDQSKIQNNYISLLLCRRDIKIFCISLQSILLTPLRGNNKIEHNLNIWCKSHPVKQKIQSLTPLLHSCSSLKYWNWEGPNTPNVHVSFSK